MGMADIEADLYGDVDNDEDLEAELLALEGKKPSPKRKPKGKFNDYTLTRYENATVQLMASFHEIHMTAINI